jgi:drug/metabolite transporter (DMT)-like permease
MRDNPRSTSIFLLIILSLIWGTSFILIKQGLKAFTSDEVGSLRVASASLFILPVAIVHLRDLRSGDLWKLFISGMMGIFIPSFLFAAAQTRMDSSVAGILNTLTPLFTMIVGAMIFKQKFTGYAIVGITLGFAGTVLLSFSPGVDFGFNTFALLIVLACFFYASNLNFIKFKIPDLSAVAITSVSLMLIGPFALIYLLGFTDFTYKLETHEGAWKAFGFIVLLGFMSTALATVLFNKLVKLSTPIFASSVTYLMPIVVVTWGFMDGERLHVNHFLGMATIIGGVYLVNRRRV